MQIFSTITNLTDHYKNIVVALGTFDGVHIGHQNIIKKSIHLAKQIGGTSVVFTFSNHPRGIVSPEKCPLRIMDNPYKETLMAKLGIDVLMNIPFTKEFLKLTPLEFLKLLQENLAPKYIVVGPNYSFGHGGKGKPVHLLNEGHKFGFTAEISEAICIENKIASSTKIRKLIAKGNVIEATKLLGRYFRIQSEVVYGDQRGRVLGFPTANLHIAKGQVMPPNGVYAVYATVKRQTYKAIANVGTNPTFDGMDRHLEVHIFDFAENIYGEIIDIDFVQRIRNEKSFPGAARLVEQINSDIVAATEILGLHSNDFMIK